MSLAASCAQRGLHCAPTFPFAGAPLPAPSIPLSLPNGKAANLTYVCAEKGFNLTVDNLLKLPADYLKNLLNAASQFFSKADPQKFINKLAQCQEGHFRFGNSLIPSTELKNYLGNLKKVDLYSKRAGIGPYQYVSPYRGPIQLPHVNGSLPVPAQKVVEISRRTLLEPEPQKTSYISSAQPTIGASATTLYLTGNALQYATKLDAELLQGFSNGSIPLYGLSSAFILYSAYNDYRSASKVGDNEGKKEATRSAFEGTTLAIGTVAWAGSEISKHLTPAALAGSALATTGTICFGLGYALGATVASYNILRCMRFRNMIDAFLLNNQLTEEQKIKGVLHFLRDKIFLTESDIEKIVAAETEKHPQASKEELQKHIENAFSLFLQKKTAKFKRRAGDRSAAEVTQKLEGILQKMENPITAKCALEEGKTLIALVKSENHKKTVLYCVLMFASLIGLAATIAGTIFSLGTLPIIIASLVGIVGFLSVYFSYNVYMKTYDNKL